MKKAEPQTRDERNTLAIEAIAAANHRRADAEEAVATQLARVASVLEARERNTTQAVNAALLLLVPILERALAPKPCATKRKRRK